MGLVGPWWPELEGAVRSSPVVVPRVLDRHDAQVPFAEDQHPVGAPRSSRRFRSCCVAHGPSALAVTARMCT